MSKQKNMTGQIATLKKVMHYLKHYIPILILSVVLATVTVALTLYFPILTGRAIDLILDKGNVDFPGILAIAKEGAIVIGITAAAQWIMNMCNNRMTYNIVRDIRRDAFERIEHLPLSYIDSHSHGDMVSRIIADVDTFADGLLMGFTQLFTGLATIIGTLLFMLFVNVKITVVVVLLTPISLFVAGFIAKKTYSMFQLQTQTRGEQTALIEEMVGNQKVVQAFCHEKEALGQFADVNDRLQKYSLRATFFSSLVNPSTRFVNSLVYAAVGITGALAVILTGGAFSVGNLSCFLSYANQYTKPFNEISGVVTELQNALACAARFFELIEAKEEEPDAADAYQLKQADGTVDIDHVYFSYVPEQKLIEDFNLHVQPGQRIAIVGPTGCGKTTLLKLLGMIDRQTGGKLFFEEHDTEDLWKDEFADIRRRKIGFVFQDFYLMDSLSVRENIMLPKILDKKSAKECMEESQKYAEQFGITHLMNKKPYELSGGEKQRVAISRALINNPDLILADEPTGNLDSKSGDVVIHTLSHINRELGKTIVMVTHDPKMASYCSRLILLKDGMILEDMRNGGDQEAFYQEILGKMKEL